MRETFQYLLLGILFIAAVGSACVPVQCLRCPNVTQAGAGHHPRNHSCIPGHTEQWAAMNGTWGADVGGVRCHHPRNHSCIPDDLYKKIQPICKKDLQVFANYNESEIDEGKEINLKCVHELKELVQLSGWKKDGKEMLDERNKTTLRFKRALAPKTGKYSCYVNGACGYLESKPHHLKINNSSEILLIVCGVSALALVVIGGLVLKYKLKRDNAKHKERMEMRNQAARSGGPNPMGPRV